VATERFRRNSIPHLTQSDGSIVSDNEGKEKIIYEAFMERLGTKSDPPMAFNLPELIEPVEGLSELSAPFSTAEIDQVVQQMPADKAPGLDGFNGQFLKSYWQIIKHDNISSVQIFMRGP
jgi:hypothetical protein